MAGLGGRSGRIARFRRVAQDARGDRADQGDDGRVVLGAEHADVAEQAIAGVGEQPIEQPAADPEVLAGGFDAQGELGRVAIGKHVELAQTHQRGADKGPYREAGLG